LSIREVKNGLVLPGGGARAAYQVGVLKAVADMLPRRARNPFPVIAGTSAGAVNAAVLASRAQHYGLAVNALMRVWSNFRAELVFKTDALSMLRSSLHWLAALTLGGIGVRNPRSLLDNQPLETLLGREIRFENIERGIRHGSLDALAVTMSGYSSAHSITVYQGRAGLEPWSRVRREGRPGAISLNHLMASIAIPFIFPPYRVDGEFFGDGVMRQTAPLSPAIHLGADRLLVIGVRNEEPNRVPAPGEAVKPPSLGQIGGAMLDNLFMDGLYADLERLTRINQLLEQIGNRSLEKPLSRIRRVEALVILPSVDIRDIALRHARELPRPVRMLLKGLGASDAGGRQLISYMLFEKAYTRELIDLGYADAMARKEHLEAFLGGEPVAALDAPVQVKLELSR